MRTVREITFNLLRKLKLTNIVGNPGSTEETFLKDFPGDFNYILALHEASVVGIADGLAQGIKHPVIVNIHTGPGLGNAMGCIVTAYQNKTPLIITAGQQARAMLLLEPLLTNIEAVNMPRPWVKWSYEPGRAEDVPAAFMRAYAMAVQQPQGPVFLSLPMDDWDKEMEEIDVFRTVCSRQASDPLRLQEFASRINASKSPVIIYGADLARSQAWDAGIQFAEKLGAKVWSSPFCERTPFPESHPQYQGALPPAIGLLSNKLIGHDLAIVIGAAVFRYYAYVHGKYLPDGMGLLQVTDDPDISAKAAIGDSLVSDALLFLDGITPLITARTPFVAKEYKTENADLTTLPLSPDAVFSTIRDLLPEEFLLVDESPSNIPEFQQRLRINQPDSFYTFSSGGLGWGMPAAVGLALAEKTSKRNRTVIAIIGDGSFQYSLQSIYTGVRSGAHIIFVVLKNDEYAILKEYALLEKTPNVPGLDLTGLDMVLLAEGYGARAVHVETVDQIITEFQTALGFVGVSVIEVAITPKLRPLLGMKVNDIETVV